MLRCGFCLGTAGPVLSPLQGASPVHWPLLPSPVIALHMPTLPNSYYLGADVLIVAKSPDAAPKLGPNQARNGPARVPYNHCISSCMPPKVGSEWPLFKASPALPPRLPSPGSPQSATITISVILAIPSPTFSLSHPFSISVAMMQF